MEQTKLVEKWYCIFLTFKLGYVNITICKHSSKGLSAFHQSVTFRREGHQQTDNEGLARRSRQGSKVKSAIFYKLYVPYFQIRLHKYHNL